MSSGRKMPWVITIDNIFIDVAREIPDNALLLNNGIKPGSQNTAVTEEMKAFAKKIIEMGDDELGTKLITSTVGGCAVNTTRSANFYLRAQGKLQNTHDFNERIMTIGAIGSD